MTASLSDAAGWLAAALCLGTFCMRNMVALRTMAVVCNLAFIAYGAAAGLMPVLALHLTLLPLNAWQLARLRGGPTAVETPTTRSPAPPGSRSRA